MSKFTVLIECDGAAFEEDAAAEIVRILKGMIKKLQHGQTEGKLLDANGNRVGEFDLNS